MKPVARPLRAALALLPLCAACDSDPYVVASSRDNGLPFEQDPRAKCEPGTYTGRFFTWDRSLIPLEGKISFELVLVNGAEFTQLGPNTKLAGKDIANNRSFSADVRTADCRAGAYSTVLEHGVLWTGLDAEGNPLPDATPIPFRGTIEGAYTETSKTFYGKWDTWLDGGGDAGPPPDPPVSGGWAATLD